MKIFEESTIAGIKLKNRTFRSATHEGLGDTEGYPKEDLEEMYIRMAKGGVGAIITGYVSTEKGGRATATQRMFDHDRYIDIYKKINRSLEQYNTPLINQIAHGGSQCIPRITGEDVVAPSPFKNKYNNIMARELREDELLRIIDNFAAAIERSQKSGFAAVQLHCAHGYLLSQFLSPVANKRSDSWGGSTENRFRIVAEIIEKAREKVGNYPIMAKFSSYDGDKGGISLDEGLRLAELFEKAGFDALEVSCGGLEDGLNAMRTPKVPTEAILELRSQMRNMPKIQKIAFKTMAPVFLKMHKPLLNYNVPAAEAIKKAVSIPIIAVGGIRNIDTMEDIVSTGKADYISMSRPFIIEPNLVNKLQEGKQKESKCINCGYCLFGCIDNKVRCYYGKIPKGPKAP